MRPFWHWLTQTDAGLLARISVGCAIFLALAISDLLKNGRSASRWREYLFLLASVLVALIYGVLNDLITCHISPEYFLYGKGLDEILGNHRSSNTAQLPWEAAKVGMKATWTVGLIVGVALLWANNPSPRFPRLTTRKLFQVMPIVVGCSLLIAMILAVGGGTGGLAFLSEDFRDMIHRDEFRPYRFMTVYGIHLGGYLGGLLGTLLAVLRIRQCRRSLSPTPASPITPAAKAP
jgi:MFS family permease